MAKACKFCDTLNENEEEFCINCGSKLPAFVNYADDLENEINKPPQKRLNLNILWILCVILAGAVLFFVGVAFLPIFPDDKLPDYDKNITAARTLSAAVENINRQTGDFAMTVNTTPRALSIYLSSAFTPSILNKKTYDPYISPRFIINAPKDNFNLCSVTLRSKVKVIPVRIELFFNSESGSWKLTGYKLGNLPVLTIRKDKLLNSILNATADSTVLKTVLHSDIKIQRSKTQIHISIKKGTPSANRTDDSGSFFGSIKKGLQKASKNASSRSADLD